MQHLILFTDPQDCSDQIKMAALTAHQSSFLLSPGGFWHRRSVSCVCFSPLQHSARTFLSSNWVPVLITTHPRNSPVTHFHANKTPVHEEYVTHMQARIHTHTHACTPQPFLRPPRAPAPALKQFIEASLHGHSFWNRNCYLIWLQVLSPLHLRLTLVHLLSTSYHTTQIQCTSLIIAIILTQFNCN